MPEQLKTSTVFLLSIVTLLSVVMISFFGVKAAMGESPVEVLAGKDNTVVRDQRQKVEDQLGRTVYIPQNAGGDVFKKEGKPVSSKDRSFLTANPNAEWQRLSGKTQNTPGRDYPFSAVYGPWKVTDGVAHEFARSPQGAALAGIHMLNGIAQGGVGAAKVTKQFVDDPQSVELANQLIANPDKDQLPEVPWATTFGYYDIKSYTDDAATIVYALPAKNNAWATWEITVHWANDDWKMRSGAVQEEMKAAKKHYVTSWVAL